MLAQQESCAPLISKGALRSCFQQLFPTANFNARKRFFIWCIRISSIIKLHIRVTDGCSHLLEIVVDRARAQIRTQLIGEHKILYPGMADSPSRYGSTASGRYPDTVAGRSRGSWRSLAAFPCLIDVCPKA